MTITNEGNAVDDKVSSALACLMGLQLLRAVDMTCAAQHMTCAVARPGASYTKLWPNVIFRPSTLLRCAVLYCRYFVGWSPISTLETKE